MVVLPKLFYEQICRQAEQVYPEECCGLLLGDMTGERRTVRKIMETENAAVDMRHRRYCIPPKAFLDAENLVREEGWDVIGAYHSHPDHPLQPSEFDRERAILYFEYVIVRVAVGRVEGASCWILRNRDLEFEREDLTIQE